MADRYSAGNVPVIDLANPGLALPDSLAAAAQDWGIFHLVNHGIPGEITEQAYRASARFFGQPASAKQLRSRSLDNPWGYYDRELTKNLRDRKEIFDFGQHYTVPWPDDPPDFRNSVQTYSRACHELALRVLDLLGEALGLEAPRLHPCFDPEHTSFTRLNYYPVDDPLATSDAPPAGPLGISRHTDAGALTVLSQNAVAGLQVYRDGWHNIESEPQTLTVNIGDMLQVWSNDLFHAPLHRVRASESSDRYSIAYFLNPARDTVVAPLSRAIAAGKQPIYRAVNWGEFRELRAQGDYGDYGEEVQIAHYKLREGLDRQ